MCRKNLIFLQLSKTSLTILVSRMYYGPEWAVQYSSGGIYLVCRAFFWWDASSLPWGYLVNTSDASSKP